MVTAAGQNINRLHQAIKTCHFYFLNSFVKHWLILTIFGMQHQETSWRKWL